MSDPTGAPEPDRRAVLVLDARGLRIEPADATDTDFDPAADLPWGADDPNPPVPTGDHDEVPVTTDPTPYTITPWQKAGTWSWVRCWQRPGDPHRHVAVSVSPGDGEWRVLVLGTPHGTVDLRAPRDRSYIDRRGGRLARAMADTVLAARVRGVRLATGGGP